MISILYVDDERSLLEIGKHFLEQTHEFTVDTATTADEALDRVRVHLYDAIISDYQLPGMDGIDLLKHLREEGNQVPFIIFTGRSREQVVIEALNAGAAFYLQKGMDWESQFAELAYKVKAAVRQRETEHQLVESRERLSEIIEFFPDATLAIDKDKRITIWNRAMEEMTGIPAAEMIGKGDYAYTVPFYGYPRPQLMDLLFEPDNKVAEEYPHLIRNRNSLMIEVLCPALYGGKGAFVSAKASPLRDREGNVVGAIESIRDITVLNQAQTEIRDTELFNREVINGVKEGIVVYDRDFRVTLWNRFMEELSGIPSEEMVGKRPFDLYPFLKVVGADRHAAAALSGAIGESGDIQYDIPQTGRSGWAKTVYSPHYDATGAIVGVIAIIRDITHRKQVEVALLESEERFRSIFNESPLPMILYDSQGVLVEINESGCDLFGLGSSDDVKGTRLGENPNASIDWSKQIQSHEQVHFESVYDFDLIKRQHSHPTTRQGKIVLDVYATPIWYGGVPGEHCVLVQMLDITDRKHAEEALKQSERKYRNIYENAVIGIYKVSPEGRFLEANARAANILGYESAEELMSTIQSIDTQIYRDPERRQEAGRLLREHGYLENFEARCIHKDGRTVWVSFNARVVRDADGRILYHEGTSEDITSRKQAEEALRYNEQRLRKFYESDLFGVIFWEMDGRITEANDRFLKMTGYSRDDLLAGRVNGFALTPPEYAYIDEQSVAELRATGVNREAFEKEYIRKDGSRVPILIAGTMLNEEKTKGVGFIFDITGRKLAEQALLRANRQLNLLTGITRHDIQNQVSVILGFLSLLEKDNDAPTSQGYMVKIRESALAIQSQVMFTKVYQDLGSHEPEWQDLALVVSHIPVSEELVLQSSLEGVCVFADIMVRKVFEILIENSVRHGGHVTVVRLSVVRSGDDLVVVYEDDGEGIPEHEKSLIFERGYGKNTGLGLLLAREILALTGIGIKETGTPGKGARFEMTVPKCGFKELKPS